MNSVHELGQFIHTADVNSFYELLLGPLSQKKSTGPQQRHWRSQRQLGSLQNKFPLKLKALINAMENANANALFNQHFLRSLSDELLLRIPIPSLQQLYHGIALQ